MKNKKYIKLLSFIFATAILIAGCKKDDPVKLASQMDTWGVRNITSTTAELSGIVVAGNYTEYGVCWSTTAAPTNSDSHLSITDPDGSVYWLTAEGLEHLTKYYARAYATAGDGTVTYGLETSFTTLANLATVEIDPITAITATTATSGGNVPYDGKSDVTAKGLVWSMEPNPAIDSTNVTIATDADAGTGTFTTNLTGLIGGIQYYVRAYATNGIGTAYSNQLTFTTEVGLPFSTTDSIKNITETTADVYANVLYTGGADITERGFSWGLAEDALNNDVIDAAPGTGTMMVALSSLTPGVTYYIAAYAENSEGRAYGDTLEFQTEIDFPAKMYIVGDATAYGWTEPGTAVNADDALFHKVAGGNDGLYWKICHLVGGSGFKISAANWNSPNIGHGEVTEFDASGVTVSNSGGNMSITTSGMYMVVLDLRNDAVKVSVTAPQVYGMGNAFGGWTGEVPANLFTVDNVAKTITSPSIPADGDLRMYVDHAWIPDWWQAEFVVNGSVIEYRNDGGDPPAIPVTTGQVITLSFDDNTGTIL